MKIEEPNNTELGFISNETINESKIPSDFCTDNILKIRMYSGRHIQGISITKLSYGVVNDIIKIVWHCNKVHK